MTGGTGDDNKDDVVVPLRPPRRCPMCGKEAVRAHYPFCSKRCGELDLHCWLSGAYVIPTKAGGDEVTDDG